MAAAAAWSKPTVMAGTPRSGMAGTTVVRAAFPDDVVVPSFMKPNALPRSGLSELEEKALQIAVQL